MCGERVDDASVDDGRVPGSRDENDGRFGHVERFWSQVIILGLSVEYGSTMNEKCEQCKKKGEAGR